MMKCRSYMIGLIQGRLGEGCDEALAEAVYESLRADNLIYHEAHKGLVMYSSVNLLSVAMKVNSNRRDTASA